MNDNEESPGTLKQGEFHPAVSGAYEYVKYQILTTNIHILIEALARCALSGNRIAQVCHETLRRVINGELISDRYLLGLTWFLKEREEQK